MKEELDSTMINGAHSMERRLRQSGLLLILGLLTEAICLFWARPISFVVLIVIGGALLLFGVAWFLVSIVSVKDSSQSDNS